MAQQPNPAKTSSWLARLRQALSSPSAILQHVSTPEPSECLGQPVTIPSDSEDLPDLPDLLNPYPPFFTPRSAYASHAAVVPGAAAEEVQENVAAAGPVLEDDGDGARVLDNFAISAATSSVATASTASVVEPEVVPPASEPQRETEAGPSTAAMPEGKSGAVQESAAAAGEPSIRALVHELSSISIPVSSIHPELAGPADETVTPCWTFSPAFVQVHTSKSRQKRASVEDAPEEQATFTPWENPVPLKQWLPINYKEPMLPGGILEEDILSIVDYMPHISPQTQAKFRWLSEWTVTMEPVRVPGPYNVVDIVIEVGRPMNILHQWRGRVLPDRRGPCLSPEIYKITNTVCEQTGNEILFWSSPCTENGPRSGLQVPLLPRTSRALRLAREQETAKSKDKENCEDGCEVRPKAPPKHKRCPLHGLPCCDDGYNEVIVPKVEGSWDTQEQVMKSLENLSRPDLMLAWAPKKDKDKDKETKVARELLAVPIESPYVLRQEYDDALNKVLRREAHYPSPLHDVITSKQGDQRMAPTINHTMAPTMRATQHPTKSYREGFFRDPTHPPSSHILMHPKDMKRLDDYDREIYARQQEMKRPGWTWKPMDFSSIADIADEQAQGALESFLLTITRPEILVSRYMDEVLHHWGTMNCEKQDDLLPHFVSHFSCRSHPTWRWNAYYHLIGAAIRRDLCQTIAAHDIRYLMTLNNGLAEYWVDLGADAPVEVLQRELAVIFSTIAKAYIVYFVRDLMNTGVFLAAPKIRMHHILRGETKDYIQPNGSLFTHLDKMPTVKINRTTEKDVLNRQDLQYDWHHLPHPDQIFKIHALLSEVAETGEIADPRAFTKKIMDLSMLKITSHSLSPLIITVFDKIRLLGSLIDPELVRPASEIDACLENFRRYTGRLPGLYSVRALQDFSYESWRSVPKRLYQHIYLRLDEKAHDLLSWPPPLPLERDDAIEHELYQFGASLIRHLRDNFKIDVPFLERDTINPELELREDGMLSVPVLDRRFAQELLDCLKERKPDLATLPKMRIAIKDPPSPQEIWEHWKKRERKRVIYADFRKSSQHGLAKVTNDKADKFMKKRMASIEKARKLRIAMVICPGSHVYDWKMNAAMIKNAISVLPEPNAAICVNSSPWPAASSPMRSSPSARSASASSTSSTAIAPIAATGMDHSCSREARRTSPPI
jgi:hypothetical protein